MKKTGKLKVIILIIAFSVILTITVKASVEKVKKKTLSNNIPLNDASLITVDEDKNYLSYPIVYENGVSSGLKGSLILELNKRGNLTGNKTFINDLGNVISTPLSYVISQSITIAPKSTTEEITVGGTESSFAITNLMRFKNVEILKTSDIGVVSIVHDNGYIRNLNQLNDSWLHSSDETEYFIISVTVSGGATYEYTGALIN